MFVEYAPRLARNLGCILAAQFLELWIDVNYAFRSLQFRDDDGNRDLIEEALELFALKRISQIWRRKQFVHLAGLIVIENHGVYINLTRGDPAPAPPKIVSGSPLRSRSAACFVPSPLSVCSARLHCCSCSSPETQ